MKEAKLTGVVEAYIRAVNASDINALIRTFAEDAFVNDSRREIVGTVPIRRWLEKEILGDSIRISYFNDGLNRRSKISPVMAKDRSSSSKFGNPARRVHIRTKLIIETPTANGLAE